MTDTSWDDYETGPFCRHWDETGCCEMVCATCGHGCERHGAEDGHWACLEVGCPCAKWIEPARPRRG